MGQVLSRRVFVRGVLGVVGSAPFSALLTACGAGGGTTPTAATATPTSATVPASPTPVPTRIPVPTLTRTPTAFKFGAARQIASPSASIAIEKGFFREEGIALEIVEIQTLGQMVPFLGTGEILAAGGALSAALFNAIR